MQRSKDENKEGGLGTSVPTFAKNAKVGHPPTGIGLLKAGYDALSYAYAYYKCGQ